ncbi:MAG: GTPase Era [Vampirovibrionales bacterium]|nr:GTPase Era [Vampirovibrionales bacterium]
MAKFGFVAVIGRPNAGKSTLVNALVGDKIAITTPVAQTTRHRIRGVLSEARGQVVFLDTPGFSKALDKLGEHLVQEARAGLDEADVLLWVVDATQVPGKGDAWLLGELAKTGKPVVLALNHWDKIPALATGTGPSRLEAYATMMSRFPQADALVVSAKTKKNQAALLRTLFRRLPSGEPMYPTDTLSDQPMRAVAAELIREQAMQLTRDDLPHSVAVAIEAFEEAQLRDEKTVIRAVLYVDHPSRQEILIGAGGQMIKQIGSRARQSLEALVEGPVYLDLRVKTQRNWRKDSAFLNRLGLSS